MELLGVISGKLGPWDTLEAHEFYNTRQRATS